jgi:excinuclease ABC subunit C
VVHRALTFSSDQGDSFFQEFPARAAVFLLRGEGEPYLSKTRNLRRRLERLLGRPTELTRRLNLRRQVREIEFTLTGSDFESQFLLYRMLRTNFPQTYSARLRIHPAPLVKLHLQNEYPRASVTTRLGRQVDRGDTKAGLRPNSPERPLSSTGEDARASRPNLYYGPFPSRAAAEKLASDVLDFFKMRRCVDDLQPDQSFPGCVYSEMKMCLAPCFKGCTDDEYHSEVERVREFFDSGGESLMHELSEQRERASADLAFEAAAAIHARIDKLKAVLSQMAEIVRPIDRLQALIIQPGPESGLVSLFVFQNCTISDAIPLSIEARAEPQSLESRIEHSLLSAPLPEAHSMAERAEHLALLQRWYYRSHRVGEIFFADEKGFWPLRRIVRGVGRVYRGERAQEPGSFSATPPTLPTSEPA